MRLAIASYNIHRAIGVDRRFRPDRIIDILAHHSPDVVLLQEVDEGAPRSRELHLASELAGALGYPYFAVGHNVELRRGRYGNATLSRHPILRQRNIDLTVDGRKRRGCQHTTVGAASHKGRIHRLEVFNLHLGLSARERTRQIAVLARSREFASLDVHVPCVVGGDFNDWRRLLHPIFTEFLGFRCATEHGQSAPRLLNTFPSFGPTGALDRIYLRGPIRVLSASRCRLPVSRVASDHLPIVAEIELR